MHSQRPKFINAVIHHALIASQINFHETTKSSQGKATSEQKGKGAQAPNASNAPTLKKKPKNKERGYKGKPRLTLKQMEQYHKDNKCYKCGESGHVSRVYPTKKPQNGTPKASTIEVLKEEGNSKGAHLSYAWWGKVREHDALILFDPGSTHNFISQELALKLGIHEFEMGDRIQVDGTFKGQEVLSITLLIGKLSLHIQGYVDKEDF